MLQAVPMRSPVIIHTFTPADARGRSKRVCVLVVCGRMGVWVYGSEWLCERMSR